MPHAGKIRHRAIRGLKPTMLWLAVLNRCSLFG
jgi:hypothetical protein